MSFIDDLDAVPAFHLAADSSASESSCILTKRLKESKHQALASEIGMDPGQLSNVLGGKVGLMVRYLLPLLRALNLKLVDANAQVIEQQDFESMARAAAVLYTKAPHLMLKG